jgi:formylglycine-generating enzyme required for sulfatase activity
MNRAAFCVLFVCILFSCVSNEPIPDAEILTSPAADVEPDYYVPKKEMRTALIIANGNYEFLTDLSNPIPEAEQLKAALERLDFEVILVSDAGKEQILDALLVFENTLRQKGGLALFHYGGHAVQVEGKNFLLPVDAEIPDIHRVKTRGVDTEEVMITLDVGGSSTNIVILDSCRDNPIQGTERSITRGLAPTTVKPKNSIIVYSAESGTVARDGVFTPALIKYIETVDLEFTDVLRLTRKEVFEKTEGMQLPGEYVVLFEPIYLAKAYGTIEVFTEKSGEVFMDGDLMGSMRNNSSGSVDTILAGDHWVEMQYEDGSREAHWVHVERDSISRLVFVQSDIERIPDSFMFVKGGTFGMGLIEETGHILPENMHQVTLDDFRMLSHEVTVGEFRTFINQTGYVTFAEKTGGAWVLVDSNWEKRKDANWRNPYYQKDENYPVTCIAWIDAIFYCNWLSEWYFRKPAYQIDGNVVTWDREADGYRLPTEAEWEYAARGGNLSRGYTHYSGSEDGEAVAWYSVNSPQAVKSKLPNELDIYDMSGNVSEWCWDWYGEYPSSSVKNPAGPPSGTSRVARGGSWASEKGFPFVYHGEGGLAAIENTSGFRVAANSLGW